FLDHWAIGVAAGGGFAGLIHREVQTQPHLECQSAAQGTPPICTPDPLHIVVTEKASYAWQPAVDTGLVFRYVFSPKHDVEGQDPDGIGVGVGAHFVFLPHGESTRAAPGLTAHVGTHSKQVFFGVVFGPTDSVVIPGGGGSAVLPADFPT